MVVEHQGIKYIYLATFAHHARRVAGSETARGLHQRWQ